MFRYLVLGLLRDSRPRHGYALMKEYRDRSGIQLSTGMFYRELQRLAHEGLVRITTNPEGEDPRRAPYEITEAGGSAFDGWFSGLTRPAVADYEDDLSHRALFISGADPKAARAVLDRWGEALWIGGKMLERAREAALTQTSSQGDEFSTLSFLLGRRLKHIAADLEFLEEFRSAYDEWMVATQGAQAGDGHQAAPARPAAPGSVGQSGGGRPRGKGKGKP